MNSGNSKTKKKYKLKKRDWAILRHIARYEMTTIEALSKQPYFEGCGAFAIENVLRCLSKHGYVKSESLYEQFRYYRLTRKSTALLGVHAKLAKPQSAQTLPRAFAILKYCCCMGEQKERLTPEQFKRLFPGFYKRGQPISYCVVRTGARPMLRYLRVDLGGNGRWDRIIEYCRRDILKRAEIPDFNAFMRSGGFQLILLTALEQKAEQIRLALSELDRPLPAHVEVGCVPELINLIVPISV